MTRALAAAAALGVAIAGCGSDQQQASAPPSCKQAQQDARTVATAYVARSLGLEPRDARALDIGMLNVGVGVPDGTPVDVTLTCRADGWHVDEAQRSEF